MSEQNKTLEESFELLNEIIGELSDDNISLETAFVKYDEGMKLVKECKDKLDNYQKKLIIVNGEEN